jgi:SAM-dependent methyltransferase
VVCGLALEHVAALDRAISELARVVRSGGRVVLSDLHPVPRTVGGAAYFQDADGAAGVVKGYGHFHGDYFRAFDQAGLVVRQCLEPAFGPDEVSMQSLASTFIPEAVKAAYLGMPTALVWDLVRDRA